MFVNYNREILCAIAHLNPQQLNLNLSLNVYASAYVLFLEFINILIVSQYWLRQFYTDCAVYFCVMFAVFYKA